MQFSEFLLERLSFLDRVTRGYGSCISERALYQSLIEQGVSTDDFFVLVQWGLLKGMLIEQNSGEGRRFTVDRQVLADLRIRANGETDKFNAANDPSLKPNSYTDKDEDQL